ncbi:hypothetical protein DENSPDRAFT_930370 [Dentipellis sp. KUC8613]|nr:hypothetical protein DENSPDRAFT_930370 [Dentipellis sp. KUC8613]
MNPVKTTIGISGTQSPPIEDAEPMGASSIRGGNAGGVPDRVQRAQYFDGPENEKTTSKPLTSEPLAPAKGTNLWESAPSNSEPMRKLNNEQKQVHDLEQQGTNNVWSTDLTTSGPIQNMFSGRNLE